MLLGDKVAYIYIVQCENGSLYTGITKDIEKRLKNHAEGTGPSHAKYMRSHKPTELCALWETDDYNVAAKLEYAIKKKLSRAQKLELIEKQDCVHEFFPHLEEYNYKALDVSFFSFDSQTK